MRKDSGSPPRPSRRLLGQVLVDGGFVSPGDLARALEEQNRTNEMLGEVLVRMKAADPAEIAAVVSIQSDLASLEDAVRSAAGSASTSGNCSERRGKSHRHSWRRRFRSSAGPARSSGRFSSGAAR